MAPRPMDIRPKRVNQILVNWKFSGFSGSGPVSVDEFMYKTQALTYQTFELLTRYISSLFEGTPNDWYHKSTRNIEWPEFKRALLVRSKDERTDVNIRAAKNQINHLIISIKQQ